MSAIAITTEDFVHWIYTVTRDPQKFPKQYRGDLVNQLRNSSLTLMKHVYRGLNVKSKTQQDLQKIRNIQDLVFDDILDIQALLMVLESLKADGFAINMDHCATMFTAIIDDHERWVKNIKRKIKRINDDMYKAQKNSTVGVTKRDADGFAILKRR
ncbi:MAG: hypothetical protein NC114_06825 [Ruminococcus flavefaciens]|nr:hypothetical protein [Ruminococcus flavefaciens]